MSENRMKEPETLFTCKACGPRVDREEYDARVQQLPSEGDKP